MEALTFVEKLSKAKPRPVYVLAGDEDFLKRQALSAIQSHLLGEADPAFAVSFFPGDRAEWPAVRGDLETLPFLSPVRIVAIEQADPFVSKYRQVLEKYVAEP